MRGKPSNEAHPLAGQGAFGVKHLEAMAKIPGVAAVCLVGGSADSTTEVAERF